MKDKLTKKRIKVDYLLVIEIADKGYDFLQFQKDHSRKLSFNRLAYAFCKHEKIDVEGIYNNCLERGIKTRDDYQNELIRIAKTPWLDED